MFLSFKEHSSAHRRFLLGLNATQGEVSLKFFSIYLNGMFCSIRALQVVVKNPPANAGGARDAGLIPGSGRIPWSRKWQLAPVFLPRKFHGQRSLVGYSSWGCKELDSTKHTELSCIINMWFWICSLVTPSVFFTSSYSITDSLRGEAQTVLHFCISNRI